MTFFCSISIESRELPATFRQNSPERNRTYRFIPDVIAQRPMCFAQTTLRLCPDCNYSWKNKRKMAGDSSLPSQTCKNGCGGRSTMMLNHADECRKRADECLRDAAQVTDDVLRETYLDWARRWRMMAHKA